MKKKVKRDFIGVTFTCCKVYSRIYLDKSRKAFVVWCPKCAAKMEILISTAGSRSRFFKSS